MNIYIKKPFSCPRVKDNLIHSFILLKPKNERVIEELTTLLKQRCIIVNTYKVRFTDELLVKFYPKQYGKPTWKLLSDLMTSDFSYVVELQTCCFECLKEIKYTVRDRYQLDEIRNVTHVPDDQESNNNELEIINKCYMIKVSRK